MIDYVLFDLDGAFLLVQVSLLTLSTGLMVDSERVFTEVTSPCIPLPSLQVSHTNYR